MGTGRPRVAMDAQDIAGRTALFHATIRGWTEGVQELVRHGADPRRANAWGCTPLRAAAEVEGREVRAFGTTSGRSCPLGAWPVTTARDARWTLSLSRQAGSLVVHASVRHSLTI
jgi:hypothetical protein